MAGDALLYVPGDITEKSPYVSGLDRVLLRKEPERGVELQGMEFSKLTFYTRTDGKILMFLDLSTYIYALIWRSLLRRQLYYNIFDTINQRSGVMSNSSIVTVARIDVPVPLPVKHTHCYAVDTGAGWLVVDAGMDTPEAREEWDLALKRYPLEGHTGLIFVTHCHPDHIGLAAWLSDRLEAPVAMMSGDADTAERYIRPKSDDEDRVRTFYHAHGVPDALVDGWIRLDQAFRRTLTLPTTIRRITDREIQTIGCVQFRFLEQGGHTDHQGLVFLAEEQILFTGDQVLSRITPNVSLWPNGEPNPLGRYLESLEYLKTLGPVRGLGAHENEIENVQERVGQLTRHHQTRNQDLLQILEEEPMDAYHVTPWLFSRRPLDDYQWRFALGETLAHLEYLVSTDEVARLHDGNLIRYQRVSE